MEEEAEVGTVTVKLPAFWIDKPEAWFAQAEANFRARRITKQMSKFNLVVVALDSDTVNGVLDLLKKPPAEDPYDQLKARLVQSFQLSTVDKVKQALELPPLADENPIRMADRLLALAGEASAEEILQTVFMLKLPEDVRRTMWADSLGSWPAMKARASRLWHAEKAMGQASVCAALSAGIYMTETNAVKTKEWSKGKGGQGKNKKKLFSHSNTFNTFKQFQQFAVKFNQRLNGPCLFHEFYGQTAYKCREPCSMAGKRGDRAAVASITSGSLTLRDASSNTNYLIDTGAEVSVVPANEQDRKRAPIQRELIVANGTRIRCYGEKKMQLSVGTRKYEWTFLVADVKRALIGADFLTHSSLLVDLRNKQMVHPDDLNATPLQRTRHRSKLTGLAFAATADPSPLAKLFTEFPTITVPNFKINQPKHEVRHTIEMRGQPIRAKARPLPPQKLAATKANFAELAAAGIIRRSSGPWSSPLHVVTKKDGSFRMCGDYRRLNTVMTPDRYSMPLISDLTARLHGKKFFGKVDLVKGYHQIPMAENDIAKTAIATPFGTFEFLRMPFGLKNRDQQKAGSQRQGRQGIQRGHKGPGERYMHKTNSVERRTAQSVRTSQKGLGRSNDAQAPQSRGRNLDER